MKIVVVESPAKAKTINKYLGPGYEVLASFGHVRDLPAKDGSVDPEHDFNMLWEVDDKSNKRLNDIARAMKRTYEVMNIPHGELRKEWTIGGGGGAAGGYWPAYMFGNGEVGEKISNFKGVPIVSGGAGNGGRAHAANEYYIIEGAGKVYGMAGAEKTLAAVLYNYAGKN